ncbi:hypothetical protein ACROYT_G015981 [Oculina patagonica]
MASPLVFVAEIDGFQHGPEPFTPKCLALACDRLEFSESWTFNTGGLAARSVEHLSTYYHQTTFVHGFPLSGPGIPLDLFPQLVHLRAPPRSHNTDIAALVKSTVSSLSPMTRSGSTLTITADLDGVQHGDEPFEPKCLAMACDRIEGSYSWLFDSSSLLSWPAANLATYRYQSAMVHDLSLSSPGLPADLFPSVVAHTNYDILLECLVGTSPTNIPFPNIASWPHLGRTRAAQTIASTVLVNSINEIVLELAEEVYPAPHLILLWVKGAQNVSFIKDLGTNFPGPLLVQVQNLEDASCPTARTLEQEDLGQLMTHEKSRFFTEWLLQEEIDSELLAR